jgi:uncharacterized membrane protein YdbT with pleckstrin-like domain
MTSVVEAGVVSQYVDFHYVALVAWLSFWVDYLSWRVYNFEKNNNDLEARVGLLEIEMELYTQDMHRLIATAGRDDRPYYQLGPDGLIATAGLVVPRDLDDAN